jgi:transposase
MRRTSDHPPVRQPTKIIVSSGRTDRHRLNRLGDRQLNRAQHIVAVNRMRCHPPTPGLRPAAPGRRQTERDIRRCIKRYLSRHLYRAFNKQLNQAPQPT